MKRPILTGRDRGWDLWGWCRYGLLQGFENSCHSLDKKRQMKIKLAHKLISNLKLREQIALITIVQTMNDLFPWMWFSNTKMTEWKLDDHHPRPANLKHTYEELCTFWKNIYSHCYILSHILHLGKKYIVAVQFWEFWNARADRW